MKIDRNRNQRYTDNMAYGANSVKRRVSLVKWLIILSIVAFIGIQIFKYLPYFKSYMSENTIEIVLKSSKDYVKYIDITAVELHSDKVLNTKDLVFYNNNKNTEKSIVYLQNTPGYESRLIIDTDNLSETTDKVVIYCTIYKELNRTFKDIAPSMKVIYKNLSGVFQFDFDLSSKGAGGTISREVLFNDKIQEEYKTLKIAELVKEGNSWTLYKSFEFSNDDLPNGYM